MKKLFIAFVFMLGIGSAYGQEKSFDFTSYKEMRAHFGQLYQQNKFNESAELLEWAINKFPDNLQANSYNLALVYSKLEDYTKGIRALQYSLDQKLWFNIYMFGQEMWNPFKETEGFDKILAQNEALRLEAQENAKPEMLVVTPEGYEKEKEYPLFLALHGGGGTKEGFKETWRSDKLKNEFITVYLQSSQMVAMNGFSWEDKSIARREILESYNKIIDQYNIKKDEIIIGGFSSGGVASIDIIMNNTLPVSGFVVLCPPRPESFNAVNVNNAKQKGIRGTIITTEMDPRVNDQKEMVKVLNSEGLQHQFILTPNIGHWFPEDLDKKIDHALNHIRYK